MQIVLLPWFQFPLSLLSQLIGSYASREKLNIPSLKNDSSTSVQKPDTKERCIM